MADEEIRWRAKLAAFVHDPPEKALVLLSGRGHEEGTVSAICQTLFGLHTVPADVEEAVRKADRWAAAADRPDRPRAKERFAAWDRIRFPERPVLVHPLSGQRYDLQRLEIAAEHAERLAFDHLQSLVREGDFRGSFHRLWRLGPEIDADGIRSLWRLLPADTRVPDHSIWEHLGLVSALAGVFATGETPALLAVSIGPVQELIAQARSTSDLWAGSHLLSTMAWEAMRPVCELLGPDAVLFPSLRGVPIVDLWLEERGLVDVGEARWKRAESDANPLFGAVLPNRFVAIVPASEAKRIAEDIVARVRGWAHEQASLAWAKIAELASISGEAPYAREQIARQLATFPEVHWACVPWLEEEDAVRAILRCLHGTPDCGVFASDPWRILHGELAVRNGEDTLTFWKPNPGVLYPAVYDALERAAAAAKATRSFEQLEQRGYRCSLCGEREWLAAADTCVRNPRREVDGHDPWHRVAEKRPAWARGTEHLCAICALKRVWPALFVDATRRRVEGIPALRRYVVSTHTMALAPVLSDLIGAGPSGLARLEAALDDVVGECGFELDTVALPQRIAEDAREAGAAVAECVRRLPATLEAIEDAVRDRDEERTVELTRRRATLERMIAEVTGRRAERYYALLLLDGDRMGGWLSSSEGSTARRPPIGQLWHPDVAQRARQELAGVERYMDASALASPGYHAALSTALGSLASEVFPAIVERAFRGKILYAGGDDLLAMAPVEDLLALILSLRCAYSGIVPKNDVDALWELVSLEKRARHRIEGGHVYLDGRRLVRTMGARATCSIGAVVAHHSTPLAAVLRDLREAEAHAKAVGRNALCITLAKRAGGTTRLACGFGFGEPDEATAAAQATPLGVLIRLRRLFGGDRRAAYRVRSWIAGLPRDPSAVSDYGAMLAQLLRHQLARAFDGQPPAELAEIAHDLARLVVDEAARQHRSGHGADAIDLLDRFVGHAEFLAREERGLRRTTHEPAEARQ